MDFFSAGWLDTVQWPAMAASIVSAWMVASNAKVRRNIGFWCFLGSNVLWVAWGLHTGAWALIALQVALAALNIRGLLKTEATEAPVPAPKRTAPDLQDKSHTDRRGRPP